MLSNVTAALAQNYANSRNPAPARYCTYNAANEGAWPHCACAFEQPATKLAPRHCALHFLMLCPPRERTLRAAAAAGHGAHKRTLPIPPHIGTCWCGCSGCAAHVPVGYVPGGGAAGSGANLPSKGAPAAALGWGELRLVKQHMVVIPRHH
jgi:hypothetical protein